MAQGKSAFFKRKKTELVLFRPKQTNVCLKYKFKINGQKLHTTSCVKYLGLQIDEHLNWNNQISILSQKLNRAVGLLSKLRYLVSSTLLRSIYFSLFLLICTMGPKPGVRETNPPKIRYR